MDLYGTIPNDETQSALNITYDNELWANVKLNHMEYEMEMDASKTFDVRWQPIFAMCAVVAKDNYDHWGNDTDLGSTSLKDADLSNYFLSNAQINDIIEIFGKYGHKTGIPLPNLSPTRHASHLRQPTRTVFC